MNLGISVHPVANTTENGSSVHPGMNAGVHPGMNTTGISVHPVGNEDPLTGPGHKTGGPVSKEVSAALGGGAEGATPAHGFEDVWKAYGRHGNKTASRAAWEAIDWAQYDYGPDHVIERAISWAASAKPGQRRMPLEKWIEAEKFDEADRTGKAEDGKITPSRKIAKRPPGPANDNTPDDLGLPPNPIESHTGRIDAAKILTGKRDTRLRLTIAGHSIDVFVESHSYERQMRGQIELGRLSDIAGRQIDDSEDLVGLNVRWSDMPDGSRKWWRADDRNLAVTAIPG